MFHGQKQINDLSHIFILKEWNKSDTYTHSGMYVVVPDAKLDQNTPITRSQAAMDGRNLQKQNENNLHLRNVRMRNNQNGTPDNAVSRAQKYSRENNHCNYSTVSLLH